MERNYTADAASNAVLVESLGDLCGRIMCIIFVTLLPVLRALRHSPRSNSMAPLTTANASLETDPARISEIAPNNTCTTIKKKHLIQRLLSFSNIFVASFLLNCLTLFFYCLLGFLDQKSLLFAPLGYILLASYGLFAGVIMTLVCFSADL